jgi:transcriptional regulator with XRE-family HTH domain
MMDWKEAHALLLQDAARRAAYNKVDMSFEIGKMIADARIARKMTQERLAEILQTQQPSIARVERGSYLPSFSFLQKIADALNAKLLPPRLELRGDEFHISFAHIGNSLSFQLRMQVQNNNKTPVIMGSNHGTVAITRANIC